MKRQIHKILIANRGEIALRVIRTCNEMNIRTVAIYSKPDRFAPFVRQADEAYFIGEAPSADSYLNQGKIIETARKNRCDAIHPGYGFLAENSSFVEKLEKEGLIFIGPSAEAIAKLGSKTSARALAMRLGIPTVPGSTSPLVDESEAANFAQTLGYPVLVKASAGGGGKGMKIVSSSSGFTSAFRSSRAESKSAFGDDRIYIEKYLMNPRHIEVQLLSDIKGNIVHLGERECSIQRRHQKLIEESPANRLDKKLRANLYEAAIELALRGNYSNAGTVEFLLDDDDNFYFLEMNSRLQVEHPVTEFRTGIDLVREQIDIAGGARLKYRQKDIILSGHAIESRICAEDPSDNFFPSTGTISCLVTGGGIGIREDRGIEEGSEITPYYDSLLSKLIAWGRDRDEALGRMTRALGEYRLFGLKNNLALLHWIMQHPKFQKGTYSTTFLENYLDPSIFAEHTEEETHLAALFTVLQHTAGTETRMKTSNQLRSGWLKKRVDSLR